MLPPKEYIWSRLSVKWMKLPGTEYRKGSRATTVKSHFGRNKTMSAIIPIIKLISSDKLSNRLHKCWLWQYDDNVILYYIEPW